MSLVLNGTTQYGHSVDGLWALGVFPFTLAAWFKPTAAQFVPVAQISRDDSNINNAEIGQHGGAGRAYIRADDFMIGGTVNLNAWNSVAASFVEPTVRRLWVNGVHISDGNGGFLPMVSARQLVVGANLNASGYSSFFAGKIAYVSTYVRGWSDADALAFHNGANPQSFPGHYTVHPLVEDGNDISALLHLTMIGAPTFDANDNPAIDDWPPSAGSPKYPLRNPSTLVGV